MTDASGGSLADEQRRQQGQTTPIVPKDASYIVVRDSNPVNDEINPYTEGLRRIRRQCLFTAALAACATTALAFVGVPLLLAVGLAVPVGIGVYFYFAEDLKQLNFPIWDDCLAALRTDLFRVLERRTFNLEPERLDEILKEWGRLRAGESRFQPFIEDILKKLTVPPMGESARKYVCQFTVEPLDRLTLADLRRNDGVFVSFFLHFENELRRRLKYAEDFNGDRKQKKQPKLVQVAEILADSIRRQATMTPESDEKARLFREAHAVRASAQSSEIREEIEKAGLDPQDPEIQAFLLQRGVRIDQL